MRQDKDIAFSLPDPEFGLNFNLDRDEKADSFEGQLLWRPGSFKTVAGAGHFDIDRNESLVLAIEDPLFGFTDTTTSDTNIKHSNLYVYSLGALTKELTVTLGLSGDFFEEGGTAFASTVIPDVPAGDPTPVPPAVLGSRDQLNPKLGVTWSAPSGTTLRAAGFRTLKRTLVTDQTLEPTQVAGFNQFFDDPSATRSWVWGVALDQKLGRKVFAGAEFSSRELTIPQTLVQENVVVDRDGSERLARAYLFTAPHDWFTLAVEYEYEKAERATELAFPFSTVRTHWVPVSARFFHPSGLSALVGATYLDQDGDFLLPDQSEFVPGERDFWVVDAGLRYRLPRRHGFLAVGVNNLTDERSAYLATDSRNLRIRPGRTIFARVVLAFP
jgi:hypothetical protein